MTLMATDGASLDLQRWPPRTADILQAWDAADEHLLRRVAVDYPAATAPRVLLLNDAWGALATALRERERTVWSDSHLTRLALAGNLTRNGQSETAAVFVAGDAFPDGTWDLVLLKLPKSLDLLQAQLLALRPHLGTDIPVLAGGMIKHTPARAYRLLETVIGPTVTSLGWKKSRLALAHLDADLIPAAEPPTPVYDVPGFDLELASRPGVFSAGRLDGGTRLLLQHLPAMSQPLRAADLGCGNGVLALALSRNCPAARVLGVDSSYLAVASARYNLAANTLGASDVTFTVGDGLRDVAPASLDLVVCNPPFHESRAVGDGAAWRLINQAHAALRPDGELRLVGNRHLGYHVKLARVFGNSRVLGADRRFAVLSAVRRSG